MLKYFAKVEIIDGKNIVTEMYQAQHDDPVCERFRKMGFIESTYPEENDENIRSYTGHRES